MGAIASQITSLTIVYSTVYPDADQRKHQSSASLAFYVGNSPGTGEFPAQMASNAENVSIWWRHHVLMKHHPCVQIQNMIKKTWFIIKLTHFGKITVIMSDAFYFNFPLSSCLLQYTYNATSERNWPDTF